MIDKEYGHIANELSKDLQLKNEELTISLCKFGGPVVFFICTPAMAWIFWQVIQKELADGRIINTKGIVEMCSIVLVGIIFGGWMCRKGYG